MARSPSACACSEKAQLEDGAADAGHARSAPPPRRCAWSVPTGRRSAAARWPNAAPELRGRRGTDRAGVPSPCSSPSSRIDSSSSPTKAVPRSKDSVTMVTRQPSFSSPTRLATGMRTSSRKSSANSVGPGDGAQRPDLDARRVHGHDQPGDPPVAAPRPVRTSSSQKSATSACDVQIFEPVTTYSSPSRTARVRSDGQVASGVGLAEALAPDLVAAQDRRQVALALLGCALGDDGRPGVEEADEVHPDVGRAGPLALLLEDQLFDRRGAPAATLVRPVDPGIARRRRAALPGACRRPGGPASRRRRRRRHGVAAWSPARRAARRGRPSSARCSEGPCVRWSEAGPARSRRTTRDPEPQAVRSRPKSLMALPRTILRLCSSVRPAICSSAISRVRGQVESECG